LFEIAKNHGQMFVEILIVNFTVGLDKNLKLWTDTLVIAVALGYWDRLTKRFPCCFW